MIADGMRAIISSRKSATSFDTLINIPDLVDRSYKDSAELIRFFVRHEDTNHDVRLSSTKGHNTSKPWCTSPINLGFITTTNMHAPVKLYHGSVVHSLSLDEIEYAIDTLICVSDQGIILWLERDVDSSTIQQVASTHGLILDDSSQSVEILQLGRSEFLCPGLIDTHTVSSYQSPTSRDMTLITYRFLSMHLSIQISVLDKNTNCWTGFQT